MLAIGLKARRCQCSQICRTGGNQIISEALLEICQSALERLQIPWWSSRQQPFWRSGDRGKNRKHWIIERETIYEKLLTKRSARRPRPKKNRRRQRVAGTAKKQNFALLQEQETLIFDADHPRKEDLARGWSNSFIGPDERLKQNRTY